MDEVAHTYTHLKLHTRSQCLIDAIVHAMDEDYDEIAKDLGRLGFLAEVCVPHTTEVEKQLQT